MSKFGGYASWLLGCVSGGMVVHALTHRVIFGNWGRSGHDGTANELFWGVIVLAFSVAIVVFDDGEAG